MFDISRKDDGVAVIGDIGRGNTKIVTKAKERGFNTTEKSA